MENATNALLMAAVVLISVIILSIGVYLFTYFADYARGVEDDVRTNQISQFNSQFLSYQGKELTIYDVISIANLAKDYNQQNEYENSNTLGYIMVTVPIGLNNIIGSAANSSNNISEIENQDAFVGTNVQKQDAEGNEYTTYELVKYRCTVTVNDDTKLVDEIIITQ